jgi:hypothetical protein
MLALIFHIHMADEDRLDAGLPMIAVAEGKWHQEMQGACGV